MRTNIRIPMSGQSTQRRQGTYRWFAWACLLSAGLMAPSARAATWYVSKNGGNSGGTSWSKAWSDFDSVTWSSLSPGDVILVDGGPTGGSMTYTARIKPTKSGTSSFPIRIERATEAGRDGTVRLFGGRTALLPKNGSPRLPGEDSVRNTPMDFRYGSWITVDGKKWGGIKVDGWTPDVTLGKDESKGSILMGTGINGVTLRNLEITNNGFTSDMDGSIAPKGEAISLAGSRIIIDHCEIHDNGGDAMQTYAAVSDLSVTFSWLHNNGREMGWNSHPHPDGIQLNGDSAHSNITFDTTVFGPGIYHGLIISPSASNVHLTNCLIDRPLTSPIKMSDSSSPGFKMDYTTIYYENNADYDHRVLEMPSVSSPIITNSIIQGTDTRWTNSLSKLTKSNNFSYKVGGTRIDNGTDVNPQFVNKGTVNSSSKVVDIASENWRPQGLGSAKAGFKLKNAFDLKGTSGNSSPTTPTVQVSVSDSSISENGGTVRLTVSRDVTDVGMNIHYTTSGSALYGTDFTSADHTFDGDIWLEAGASRRDINIATVNNSVYNPDKTFNLQLTAGTGYQLSTTPGATTATFTIANDDVSSQAVPYPSASTPASIPGTLQAENYDVLNAGGSGEGITYHDVTAANQGGAYRTSEGVDVSNNAGFNYVSYTRDGEWLAYTVKVTTAGRYKVRFHVANNTTAGTVTSLRLKLDGNYLTDDVTIDPTGSWTSYTDVEAHGLQLAATPSGQTQQLRLEFTQSSPDASAPNVDYFQFLPDDINVMSNLAVSDAYVRDGAYANSNFGTETLITNKLGVTADYNREVFIRFDLTPYAGLTFTRATAVLNTVNVDEPNGNYPSMDYAVSTLTSNPAWSETGITWNNSRGYATSTPVYQPIQEGENRFDLTQALVTALANGQTSLTLKLASRYADAARVDMDSREGLVKPRLEVQY